MALSSAVRPWGVFHVLDEQADYKVKRLVVEPGGRLSLQSHLRRQEHWTVMNGLATVTVGERVLKLSRGQAIDIPLGERHRLENLDRDTVEIIEIQFGEYLGEDDVTRHEDAYDRFGADTPR